MLILTTKLKNAINKKKPGMEFSLHQISVNGNKRGTSGWIRNPENNSVVYVNTEGIKWNGRPIQYMYRYADDMKDTHGYHNRWATSLEELVNGITELLLFPVSEVKDCRCGIMPEPEKKLIEVTVEKRLRVCKEIEATEEEIEFLRRGENPFESEFSDEEMEHGDIEWDFAAADEYGRTIVGWD